MPANVVPALAERGLCILKVRYVDIRTTGNRKKTIRLVPLSIKCRHGEVLLCASEQSKDQMLEVKLSKSERRGVFRSYNKESPIMLQLVFLRITQSWQQQEHPDHAEAILPPLVSPPVIQFAFKSLLLSCCGVARRLSMSMIVGMRILQSRLMRRTALAREHTSHSVLNCLPLANMSCQSGGRIPSRVRSEPSRSHNAGYTWREWSYARSSGGGSRRVGKLYK